MDSNNISESGVEYNDAELLEEYNERCQTSGYNQKSDRDDRISEMDKIKLSFIVKLKDIKAKHKLTNSQLAHSIGVSRQSLHNMINGTQNPSLELICKVASVYSCKLILK